jgi:HK97 family phage major capsid protein
MSDKTTDVFEEVKSEVEKIGELSKENFEKLNKTTHDLRAELDSVSGDMDALKKLKVDRLVEDAITRQEEIEKKHVELSANHDSVKKHLEEIDAMVQRNVAIGVTDEKMTEDVKHFVLSMNAVHGKNVGLEGLEKQIEEYASALPDYKKAFETFLRKPGDESKLSPDMYKALSVGSEPDGGFAVTPFMSNQIIERLYESSPIRALANIETISTDAFEQMVDWDDTTSVGWESETIAGGETDTPKMQKLRIPVHVMYAKPLATQQLLEDAAINVEAWLSRKAADKMARTEATSFVTGDGIGKPRGFLTYPTGTGRGQVEQVNMGAADRLTVDGFISVKYALIEQFLNRGTWLMNRTAVAAAMKLKGGDGYYIWKPSQPAGDPQSTILGSPVRMASDMPEVAANALAVAYADWNEAYTIVDRLGITLQRDPYTKKPFVEFYFRKRLGGDVVNPQAIKIGRISA